MLTFNRRATKAIKGLIGVTNKPVIDIGCGDGAYTTGTATEMGAGRVAGGYSNLPPLFRHDLAASVWGWLTPKRESFPLTPHVLRGLYCVAARKDDNIQRGAWL